MGCRNHPQVLETRICPGCNSHWCDSCPRRLQGREVCPDCGRQLQSYVVVRSLTDSIADAVGRVLSIEAVITAAMIAVPNALVGFGWIWGTLYSALLVSYYFMVIGHVGDGRGGLPGPADSTFDIHETIRFAWRGMIVNFVGFLPLIIWLIHGAFSDPAPFHGEFALDPDDGSVVSHGPERALATVLGLLAIGQLYMPAVILAVTVTNSTWAALYPVAWFQIMSRAPGRYFRFAIVWIGSVGVGVGVWVVTSLLLPPTLVGNYGEGFFWCMFSIVQAALIGNYLRENGSAFGWETFPPVASVPIAAAAPAPQVDARPRTPSAAPAAGDMRYAPTRARRQSRMPSSIPLDGPIDDKLGSSREAINYAVSSLELAEPGIEAIREDGTRLVIQWNHVVGLVARRLPPTAGDDVIALDVVSVPGATVRVVPWTRIIGAEIAGSPQVRARRLIELVLGRCPGAKLDGGTRGFVDGQSALQIPDAETMAEHDRRLA
jgi:hypothetical protein